MNTMTIRAKNLQIFTIGVPLPQTLRPVVIPILRYLFSAAVFVVYIQHSNIWISTPATPPTKRAKQLYAPFPMPEFFRPMVNRLVPEVFKALIGTVSSLASLAAGFALTTIAPPSDSVAFKAAILRLAIIKITAVRLEHFTAGFTRLFNRWGSDHLEILSIPVLSVNEYSKNGAVEC